jgi:hypothetical protein
VPQRQLLPLHVSPGRQVALEHTQRPLTQSLPPPQSCRWLQTQAMPLHTKPSASQLLLQPPQLVTLLVAFVSQPLSGPLEGRMQLAKPISQYDRQDPLLHSSAIVLVVAHGRLQLPQCERFASVGSSQPVSARPSQFPKSGSHDATPQAPALQLAVAFCRSQGVQSLATPH